MSGNRSSNPGWHRRHGKALNGALSKAEANKYASIYATPEEVAHNVIYTRNNTDRLKAKKNNEPLPPLKGLPLLTSPYDPSRPEVQLPEGPLLPPRKYRPHGAFYSEQADQKALDEVNDPNRPKSSLDHYRTTQDAANARLARSRQPGYWKTQSRSATISDQFINLPRPPQRSQPEQGPYWHLPGV